MLAVFLTGVAPSEYLHNALYHHHDTVHPVYKKGEIVITQKHIHCAFLGFVFAPYVATSKQFLSFTETPVHVACYVLPAYTFHYSAVYESVCLRGPPFIS